MNNSQNLSTRVILYCYGLDFPYRPPVSYFVAPHSIQFGRQPVDFQLAPPHMHRRNAAERAIRTFKNHFIAILCGTDPNFPIALWDRLLPQALLTLNLLRPSRINPRLSAYAQLHGAFDYNRTPIGPLGTKIVVHIKPEVRETWAPHAAPAWYIGPAMDHYRCYRSYILETRAERTADTIEWFSVHTPLPTPSAAETIAAAAQRLITALKEKPKSPSPLDNIDPHQLQALDQLSSIFGTAATQWKHRQSQVRPITALPRVIPTNNPPLPRVPHHEITYTEATMNPGQRRRAKARLTPTAIVPATLPTAPNPHNTRSQQLPVVPTANQAIQSSTGITFPYHTPVANTILHPITGMPVSYTKLITNPATARMMPLYSYSLPAL